MPSVAGSEPQLGDEAIYSLVIFTNIQWILTFLVFDHMSAADVPRRSPRRRAANVPDHFQQPPQFTVPVLPPRPQQQAPLTLKAIQEIPLPKCDLDLLLWDERRFSSDLEELIFLECEEPLQTEELELEELGEMQVCLIDDVVTIVAHHTPRSLKRLSRVIV